MDELLAQLPLAIGSWELRPLRAGSRETTEARLAGGGLTGRGEDVTHDARDRAFLRGLDLAPLRGVRSLGELAAALDGLPFAERTSWPVVASYRRWALESAALDLALLQAGLSLPALARVDPRPVGFVVSLRVESQQPVLELLRRQPTLRLKLDARSSWSEQTIAALAATGAVEIVDLKGTAPSSAVHEPPDRRRYERLAAAFPAALFEDPAPQLAGLLPQVAWDEPVQRVADLDRLPRADAINVKPARLGSLAATLRLVEACRLRGIEVYGGGHSELGPGRGQLQLLASLLYPDAPNDVAPGKEAPSPLVPRLPAVSGFRWA